VAPRRLADAATWPGGIRVRQHGLLSKFPAAGAAQVGRRTRGQITNPNPDASNWKSRRHPAPYLTTLFCERRPAACRVAPSRSMISASPFLFIGCGISAFAQKQNR